MVRLNLKVIPNAKKNEIKKEGEKFKIYVKEPAKDNKANLAVIELLADFFNIKKNHIKIISGEKSRNKIIVIG